MISTTASIREPYPTQSLENQFNTLNKVGMGWMTITSDVRHASYWLKVVKDRFNIQLRNSYFGWRGYNNCAIGALGIHLGWSDRLTDAERLEKGVRKAPNEGYCTLDIPQTALESLPGDQLVKFLCDVGGCPDASVKRFDGYYDDHCKIVSPEAVSKGLRRGGVAVPRLKNAEYIQNQNLSLGSVTGGTLYLGSRKSQKYVRFYDKHAQSNGLIDAYRWEVEFKDELAQKAFDLVLEHVREAWNQSENVSDIMTAVSNACKSLIKGAVDFREIPMGAAPCELGSNWAARCDRVWWWEELMQGLEPAKLVLNRVKPSLQSTVSWIRSQVAQSFAVMIAVYQHWNIPKYAFIDTLEAEGSERWNQKHYRMIEEGLLASPAWSA